MLGILKVLFIAVSALNLENSDIGDLATDDILTVLSHDTNLQELHLGVNNLKATGFMKIGRSLQVFYSKQQYYAKSFIS